MAESLRSKYPSMVYLLDDPDIGPILEQADREGWPPEKLQSRIEATAWWRTKSSSLRTFLDLQATDPASLQREVEKKTHEVATLGRSLGLNLTWEQYRFLAENVIQAGWNENELRYRMVHSSGGQFGAMSPVQSRVRELASQYFIPINNEAVAWWTRAIAAGEYTEENFNSYLQDRAKEAFPHLAKIIDTGVTLAQYSQPFVSTLANLLEINPAQIDFINNPRWRQVLDQADEQGNHRAMTMYEVEQFARQQPEWRNTRNARDQVSQLGQTLLEQFGKVA